MTIGQKVAGAVNGNTLFLSNHPQWDDISNPVLISNVDLTTGRLSYDLYNGGLIFATNARYPEEPVVAPIQLKHAQKYGAGAAYHAHVHWLQEQAAIPNFLMAYKLTNYGTTTTKETDYSNYTLAKWDNHKFTYTSGVLPQITEFVEIDLSGATISASLDVVVFRDTANVSTLFAGADPVAAGVTVKFIDGHVMFDSAGSRQEYVK